MIHLRTDFTHPFYWDKETNTISVEMSDLKDVLFYPAPTILTLHSKPTGNSVVFMLENVDKSDEGEIYGWIYKNKTKILKLLIIND